MRRRRLSAAMSIALLVALWLPGEGPGQRPGRLSVTLDRTSIATDLGSKFAFTSTIANHGSAPASGLIAHLNVLSVHGDVYVDPEDWSSSRTHYLDTLAPGGSTTIRWRMQAVNSGEFAVYVAVLRSTGSAHSPTAGPTLRLAVAERETLDSGGVLPLALGIPALLGLLALGLRLRRKRREPRADP